nr:hypothetical protein [uncultured Arsenicibacter sp.]
MIRSLYRLAASGICLMLAFHTHAQRIDSTASGEYRWVIKLAPLAIIDPDNTVQLAAEYLFGQRSSVQAEFGYGWNNFSLYNNQRDYRFREVWRSRAELRTYWKRRGQYRTPVGAYWAVEAFYKQVNNREKYTIGRECQSGPCAYYQQIDTPITKYISGGNLKLGFQGKFSSNPDDHIIFDVYMGFGLRFRNVQKPDVPTDSDRWFYESRDLFGTYERGKVTLPNMTAGFKIGYGF